MVSRRLNLYINRANTMSLTKLSAKTLIENGIKHKDTFSTEILERGKLAPNAAYELSKGKGLFRVGFPIRPDRYKVEIVFYDDKNNEIKRLTGISSDYEEYARKYISEQRQLIIDYNNYTKTQQHHARRRSLALRELVALTSTPK